jgi:hypothetical protein
MTTINQAGELTHRGKLPTPLFLDKLFLMKKIIAAFDGLRFSESTLREAISLARQHNAHLVGVFLQEFVHTGFAVFEALVVQSAGGKEMVKQLDEKDTLAIKTSISLFQQSCQEAGINYSIHRDKHTALRELLHESIFADLLVIDRYESFSSLEENIPGWFMKNLLHGVQCPVWLTSKKENLPKRLVFLYDGEPSSIYAMKMFTYLFPEMSGKEVKVLAMRSGTLDLHLPDNKLVQEWMKRHYTHASYKVVAGDRDELLTLLKEEGPEVLLVTGAYDRSKPSMWLRPSLADTLLQKIKAPLFLAHP